jgi:hypothetical protein
MHLDEKMLREIDEKLAAIEDCKLPDDDEDL